MRLTLSQFLEHEARLEDAKLRKLGKRKPASAGVEIESKLHEQIIAECRRRGWYYVHSRMDRRTTTALGVVDFIVAADGGRTFWIEAKARNKKPTREQAGAISWLTMLGHKAIIVHNLDGFIAAVAGC